MDEEEQPAEPDAQRDCSACIPRPKSLPVSDVKSV